jgi:hypothetical protein
MGKECRLPDLISIRWPISPNKLSRLRIGVNGQCIEWSLTKHHWRWLKRFDERAIDLWGRMGRYLLLIDVCIIALIRLLTRIRIR